MPQCLTDLGGGSYQLTSPQPEEFTGCTFLIVQPSELPNEFMLMTVEEGLYVGALFISVLAVGFTFRAVARALNVGDTQNET